MILIEFLRILPYGIKNLFTGSLNLLLIVISKMKLQYLILTK